MDAFLSQQFQERLQKEQMMDKAEQDDHFRFLLNFRSACNHLELPSKSNDHLRFKSITEHAPLLLYAFINAGLKSMQKHIKIPGRVRSKCIEYLDIPLAEHDKWCHDVNLSTNNHAILSNKSMNMELYAASKRLKVVKYGYGECQGIHRMRAESIRKLWKIQVLFEKKVRFKMEFTIGIDSYSQRYHFCVRNSRENVVIENEDVVTLLFCQYEDGKNRLQLAINGKQHGNVHQNIRIASGHGHAARMFVAFIQQMQFVILPK